MDTHRNRDHLEHDARELQRVLAGVEADRGEAWRRMEAEAERMKVVGASTITGGEEGESVIRQWEKYGVLVRELPERETDEALAMVRVSLGFSPTEGVSYCVFRGPVREVKDVLRRALNALRDAP